MNTENIERKHSGLGMASFSICIIVGIAHLLIFITPLHLDLPDDWGLLFFCLATLFISLIALWLGIRGLKQKDRKKLFAILGIVLSVSLIFFNLLLLFLLYYIECCLEIL